MLWCFRIVTGQTDSTGHILMAPRAKTPKTAAAITPIVILVTKLKGGSGATTLTRELATYAASEGRKTAVIDLDGQGSLTSWWRRRETESDPALLQIDIADVVQKLPAIRAKYDFVVIDTPPSTHPAIAAIAAACDRVLIPTHATPDDLDTIGSVIRSLNSVGSSHHGQAFVLTAISGKRSIDATLAEEVLSKQGPVIGRTTNRNAYYRPVYEGKTGNETDATVRSEIRAIYKSII